MKRKHTWITKIVFLLLAVSLTLMGCRQRNSFDAEATLRALMEDLDIPTERTRESATPKAEKDTVTSDAAQKAASAPTPTSTPPDTQKYSDQLLESGSFSMVDPEAVSDNNEYAVICSKGSVTPSTSSDSITEDGYSADYNWLTLYNIIGKDNTLYGGFWANGYLSNLTISNDGLVSFEISSNSGKTCILDKHGNILVEGYVDSSNIIKDGEYYYNVSYCGNTIRETFVNDFEFGEGSRLELVSSRGESLAEIATCTDANVTYMGLDIFHIEYTDAYDRQKKTILYNTSTMQSKDLADVDMTVNARKCDILSDKLMYDLGVFITFDMEIWQGLTRETPYDVYSPMKGVISNNASLRNSSSLDYILSNKYFYYKNCLYTMDGSLAKDLSAGDGVKQIAYCDEKYCIESNTGYYYALDGDLNQIVEPIQFGEDNKLIFTDYGVLAMNSDLSDTLLYSLEGELQCHLPDSRPWGSGSAYLLGFTYHNFNLNTQSIMEFQPFSFTDYPIIEEP